MKILLITDVPPSKAFSGSLFTDRLCSFLPEGSLAAFIVVNPLLKHTPVSPELGWIPMEYCEKPNESGILTGIKKYGTFFAAISQLATFTKELCMSMFKIPGIVRRIHRFGKGQKADRVWCILQGQTMIRIALRVSGKLGVPLYTQVWDPPQWWLGANSIDRITFGRIMRIFGRTMAESRRMAAASFNMAKIYKERHGADTVPVIPSLDKSIIRYPEIKTGNEKLIIAIAGQIYATDAWNSLLEALDSAGWVVNGKRVIVRIMSYYLPDLSGHNARYIEFLGYRSQEESISILSESDILYLPYWFDTRYDEVVKLSFPSKLTAYLAAGRPVLCHAPGYASPSIFIAENDAGYICSVKEIESILKIIENIDMDHAAAARKTENGRIALHKYLSDENMAKQFAEFLEIHPGDLRNG